MSEEVDGDVYIVWWFEQSSVLSAHLSLSHTIRIAPQGKSHYGLVIVNITFTILQKQKHTQQCMRCDLKLSFVTGSHTGQKDGFSNTLTQPNMYRHIQVRTHTHFNLHSLKNLIMYKKCVQSKCTTIQANLFPGVEIDRQRDKADS